PPHLQAHGTRITASPQSRSGQNGFRERSRMTGPARLRSVGAMTRNAPIRVAAAITAGLVAAGSVAGCGLSTNRFSDEHTEAVALTAITTDGGSGSVTCRPGRRARSGYCGT